MSMTHMSSDRVRVITLLKKSNGPDLLCVHISVSPIKVPNYFSPLGFFFPTFPPAVNIITRLILFIHQNQRREIHSAFIEENKLGKYL